MQANASKISADAAQEQELKGLLRNLSDQMTAKNVEMAQLMQTIKQQNSGVGSISRKINSLSYAITGKGKLANSQKVNYLDPTRLFPGLCSIALVSMAWSLFVCPAARILGNESAYCDAKERTNSQLVNSWLSIMGGFLGIAIVLLVLRKIYFKKVLAPSLIPEKIENKTPAIDLKPAEMAIVEKLVDVFLEEAKVSFREQVIIYFNMSITDVTASRYFKSQSIQRAASLPKISLSVSTLTNLETDQNTRIFRAAQGTLAHELGHVLYRHRDSNLASIFYNVTIATLLKSSMIEFLSRDFNSLQMYLEIVTYLLLSEKSLTAQKPLKKLAGLITEGSVMLVACGSPVLASALAAFILYSSVFRAHELEADFFAGEILDKASLEAAQEKYIRIALNILVDKDMLKAKAELLKNENENIIPPGDLHNNFLTSFNLLDTWLYQQKGGLCKSEEKLEELSLQVKKTSELCETRSPWSVLHEFIPFFAKDVQEMIALHKWGIAKLKGKPLPPLDLSLNLRKFIHHILLSVLDYSHPRSNTRFEAFEKQYLRRFGSESR